MEQQNILILRVLRVRTLWFRKIRGITRNLRNVRQLEPNFVMLKELKTK